MGNERKTAADCDRFLHEYIELKGELEVKEEAFLLGYYAHLITDLSRKYKEVRYKIVVERINIRIFYALSRKLALSECQIENFEKVSHCVAILV